jgi:hypothetical protein
MFKRISISILIIGSIIRFGYFIMNSPMNSYDDHVEVVQLYADDLNRPEPFDCWECYQPPVYYIVSATIYKAASLLTNSKFLVWKSVQLLNTILSIACLLIGYKILNMITINDQLRILILTMISVFPRDIYTSAMIGNDYLLLFFAVCSFYQFIKISHQEFDRNDTSIVNYALLCFLCLLGGLTKQHGLILFILPFIIILRLIMKRKRLIPLLFILSASVLIALMDEAWKFNKTHQLLVSNQHYFDYAINQLPGTIDKVEFFSFRLLGLIHDPYLSTESLYSFATEIFARTMFDYEWRFTDPSNVKMKYIGISSYILGLIWIVYLIGVYTFSAGQKVDKRNTFNVTIQVTGIIVLLLYLAVPVIQTMRYPYFSSMKAMFLLPGLYVFIISLGASKNIKLPKHITIAMCILSLLFSLFSNSIVLWNLSDSYNHLSGPLWEYKK